MFVYLENDSLNESNPQVECESILELLREIIMNIYLVILLIIAIVVFSNLIMFAAVRRSGGVKFNWLNTTKESLSQPFQHENSELNELRQRVKELEKQSEEEPE